MKRLAAALLPLFLVACATTESNQVEEASVPRIAPAALQLEAMDGGSVDLNEVLASGRSVAFVFWQTWCGSCLSEAPHVGAAARELAGEVQFVGVIPGPSERVDDEKARAIAAEKRMEFPHVRDRRMVLSKAFEVSGTPTIVVLRPDGTLGYRGRGLPATNAELR